MPFTRPFRVGLNVPFEEAIRQAQRRGVKLPEDYYGNLQGVARAQAFSVAGLTALDQITMVRDTLSQAIAQGSTFETWKEQVTSGELAVDLPTSRLDNIFRTNLQTSYNRGHWEHQKQLLPNAPFLMYDAVNDSRTRPAHKAMDNFIARYDDPIWRVWYPPNGYRCRCTTIALTPAEAQRRGFKPNPMVPPDAGWEYDIREAPLEGIKRATREKVAQVPPKMAKAVEPVITKAISAVPSEWKKVGEQRGSNPGGIYEAADGSRYYVKLYPDPQQISTEIAAFDFYRQMGVDALEAKRVTIDGKQGVASAWRDDLRPATTKDLTAKPEQAARLYQASVLTKNWDFIGQSRIDNVMVDRLGNLVMVDAGASFERRAQGGTKPYGGDIAEVHSFLDPKHRNPAAGAYKEIFDRDVFMERDGARGLMDLTRLKAETAFTKAGFDVETTNRLTRELMARREALIDRYNLDGRWWGTADPQLIKGVEDFMRKLDSSRLSLTNNYRDRSYTQGDLSDGDITALKNLQKKWAAYIEEKAKEYRLNMGDKTATDRMKTSWKSWSGSASGSGGAWARWWAEDRFGHEGVRTNHHGSNVGDEASAAVQRFANDVKNRRNQDNQRFLNDAEYALTQYVLRRAHGYDPKWIERGISSNEFANSIVVLDDGSPSVELNAVTSTTSASNAWAHTDVRVGGYIRAERFIKTWWQGKDYMGFGRSESEFVALGTVLDRFKLLRGSLPAGVKRKPRVKRKPKAKAA